MSGRRPLGSGFWRLWVASTGSNIGDGVVIAALPLLAAQLTRDPVEVAAVTFVANLPWLLFGLFAGVVVDRTDRRVVMWIVDFGRAAVLVLLVFAVSSGLVGLPILYLSVLLLGIGETLFDTAAQSVLPAVVRPGELERANGYLFGAQLTANGFIGPPLGGFLFAAGVALPFGFDVVTFVASSLLIMTLAGSFKPVRGARTTVRADLKEGLAFLWRHRIIRGFAVGAAVINVAYVGAGAILVLYAQDVLGLDEVGFGLLLSGAAVGGIAGTVLAAPVVRLLGRANAVIGAVAVFGLALGSIAFLANPWAVASSLAIIALATEIWNVVAVSYRQAAVPDQLLGRIMASYRFIAYGAFPVGAASGGFLARAFSLTTPFLVGGVLTLLLVFFLLALLRGVDLAPSEPTMEPVLDP